MATDGFRQVELSWFGGDVAESPATEAAVGFIPPS
jgi:hypothetical protein